MSLNPTQWCVADKVILAAMLILPSLCAYAVIGHYLLAHPEVAPYFDREFARHTALKIQTWVIIPAWVAVTAIGFLLRRHSPDNRLLMHAALQLYFVWFGACAYFLGSHTTMFTPLTLLSGAIYSFIMFGTGPTMLGIAAYLAVITASTVAEQAGVLLYAPMLLEPPVKDRHLTTSWLLAPGALDLTILLAVLALVRWVVERWREYGILMAQTSEQLARANEFISRYVASQLVAQIREGNFEPLERHQRRRLTLFFSDIKDFTEIAERAEPEALSDALNEYLSAMTMIAERYGGTVDKFVGDAIMIFFGAPVQADDQDQAQRAVFMAMEMQERITTLNRDRRGAGLERPFEVRIGINTGHASVGNFGSKDRVDYTAIVRQVNLAARLQAACTPNGILLSHSTWTLVQDKIDATAMGEIQVKGFQTPVKVYQVVGRRASCPS
jgi:adenylate cyclase